MTTINQENLLSNIDIWFSSFKFFVSTSHNRAIQFCRSSLQMIWKFRIFHLPTKYLFPSRLIQLEQPHAALCNFILWIVLSFSKFQKDLKWPLQKNNGSTKIQYGVKYILLWGSYSKSVKKSGKNYWHHLLFNPLWMRAISFFPTISG